MRRIIDRTKKSNIKCEHCRYYVRERSICIKYGHNLSIDYWKRRACFEWPELT